MESFDGKAVVVVGATGNVGPFVVRALLERDAVVVAPSRSQSRLDELRASLRTDGVDDARLHGVVGSLSDDADVSAMQQRVADETGPPVAALSGIGDFVTTPSLLDADPAKLRRTLESYVVAHLVAARAFAPAVSAAGGTYVMLQGPLAFELHPEFDTHLISIATAAQHMLFAALAQELAASAGRAVELVSHTFIRNQHSAPQSPVSGEVVGAYAAGLLAGAGAHTNGTTIHLQSADQLSDLRPDHQSV